MSRSPSSSTWSGHPESPFRVRPGTGKTHTIANIVCHYLATGRRVLVTSRGERALEILRDKIPEEVRALTVALLASDREGVRQFQAAIEAIQHQVSQLNPEITKREIVTLTSAIDRAHGELVDARRAWMRSRRRNWRTSTSTAC